MMTKLTQLPLWRHLWIGVAALLLAVAFYPQAALAQAPDVSIDLCATAGSTTLPDGTTVPVWGYTAGNCTGGAPRHSPAARCWPSPRATSCR